MDTWFDSPGDWEALLGILIILLGGLTWLIRTEVKKNGKSIAANSAEMIPNHGSSLRDAVDRIERRISEIHTDVRAVDSKLTHHIDWHLEKETP